MHLLHCTWEIPKLKTLITTIITAYILGLLLSPLQIWNHVTLIKTLRLVLLFFFNFLYEKTKTEILTNVLKITLLEEVWPSLSQFLLKWRMSSVSILCCRMCVCAYSVTQSSPAILYIVVCISSSLSIYPSLPIC